MESLKQLEKKKGLSQESRKEAPVVTQKQQYLERKNYEKELRKIKNKIDETEKGISACEAKLKHLLEQLNDENSQQDVELLKTLSVEYSRAEKENESLYLLLDELNSQLEEMEKNRNENPQP